jgi:hypothetical protein
MIIGVLFGGFVPIAIYFTTHRASFSWGTQAGAFATAGLVYSLQTVYQSARQVFGQVTKAAGFTVLLEGVMVTTDVRWLGITALVYLVVINALSAGVNVALGQRKGNVYS